MRLHIFQHEVSCGPANLLEWTKSRAIEINWLQFHKGATVPSLDEVEAVVILGGPMNAYMDEQFPHLKAVRAFTREALLAEKKVFGICLGAQIMADSLGSRVVRAPIPEKGWLEVTRRPEAAQSPLLDWLPEQHRFVSWHGDTFAVPEGAIHGASSADCPAQAFAWGKHALATQFHPEADVPTLEGWINDDPEEARPALRTLFFPHEDRFEAQKHLFFMALDGWINS
ncbi:type 1 glutamine amidotransferase [bacterium]|nr:MAG: type 1 glutamine amidotransferase [bacterium]